MIERPGQLPLPGLANDNDADVEQASRPRRDRPTDPDALLPGGQDGAAAPTFPPSPPDHSTIAAQM
jgi:hypothetical protein